MYRLLCICLCSSMLAIVAGCARTEAPIWRTVPVGDSRLVTAEPRESRELEALAEVLVEKAVEERGSGLVKRSEVWVTIIDARDPRDPRMGSYQGDELVYPASVAKLPYLVTAMDLVWTRRLVLDKPLKADLMRMIVDSDNVATNAVLDRISNTGYGPTLGPAAMESFVAKRQLTTRYMESLGFEDIKASNKTFSEEVPFYGRDVASLGDRKGDNYENSNMMSTDDTARLLYLIWNRSVVAPEACDRMLELMLRGEESTTFFSSIVPEGVTLYSKDGYAGPCRHDAGIFVLPDGRPIIVVAFSKFRVPKKISAEPPRVIERIAELALEELQKTPGELDNASRDRIPGSSNR